MIAALALGGPHRLLHAWHEFKRPNAAALGCVAICTRACWRSWWAAGLEMTLAGVIVGGATYMIGLAFPT